MTLSIITRKTAGVLAAFAFLASSFYGVLAPAAAHAADNAITNPASGITETDATLNGTSGDSDADGHSFWVSTSTFSTATPSPIPDGVYSTDDLGAIASNTPFSAQLSSANGLPAVTPNTTYYFAAWASVGGTWYPGSVENFTTAAAPGNTAPVAADDSYSVDQDTTLTVNAADGVLDNDTDADSDALTAATTTDVSNGTLSFNSDGSFTYVPDAGFTGTDSFTYTANDGTDDSNAATVTITVNAAGGGSVTPTTVTVTPSSLQGWTESSDAGGSAAIVADSSHTGDGALELTTTSDVNSVTHYTHAEDVALSDVTSLSYDTKQVSAADATNGNATLRISVNLDGTGSTVDDQLMYEPYYNGFSGSTDWNTWTITQTGGKLWSNNSLTYNGKGGVSAGGYDSNFTLADVLHDHPNARIVGIVASMGTYNVSQQVLVDDVNLTTSTDDTTYDFEQNAPVTPPACDAGDDSTFDGFTLGSVDGQNGWSATGPYDQAIVDNTYGYDSLGCKSLRVSNATTSGSFGDWIFSPATSEATGEADATTTGAAKTLNDHFEMQFDLAAANTTPDANLQVSVAPTGADGTRMSYLRFEDSAGGINVFFDDVQGTSSPANFVETQIAGGAATTSALDRTVPHTIRLTLDTVDGPDNDVVNVYIDGTLVHTGTSWENYYRYDPESQGNPHDTNLENVSRSVDRMIIQARGNGTSDNDAAALGNGFLFDNVTVTSGEENNGGGGGGGGGGHHSSHSGSGGGTTTTGNTGGEVLGAATYNFTHDLTIGSTGPDVTALQQYLIAAGFSIPAGATGYFGAQTQSALAAFQAARGIYPPAGYFGPITRAYVMAHGVAGTGLTDAQRAAILQQIQDILAEIVKIQAQIDAMK